MGGRVKAQRQQAIARLLRRRPVTSQAMLGTLLRQRGLRVTQATLSRDLEELGAYKARMPDGRVAYRLPEDPAGSVDHLQRMLLEFASDVAASGPLVVIRTPPGCAQPVARALDTADVKDIIGTLAGDDTILIVCREGVAGRTVARRLEALAGALATKEA